MAKQNILKVETILPPKHCGEITVQPDFINTTAWPASFTAMEADSLADELRSAANRVRLHNAQVSRPRWP